jgi:hypothetical protein
LREWREIGSWLVEVWHRDGMDDGRILSWRLGTVERLRGIWSYIWGITVSRPDECGVGVVDRNDDTYVRWQSSVDGVEEEAYEGTHNCVLVCCRAGVGVKSDKGNKH